MRNSSIDEPLAIRTEHFDECAIPANLATVTRVHVGVLTAHDRPPEHIRF